MQKESQAQTFLGNEILNTWDKTAAFELKLVKLHKRKSLPHSDVKPHQVEGLLKAKHEGLFHKISDAPIFPGQRTRFTKPKPFDCLVVKGDAYVVICFYEPRKTKEFVAIDIDDWVREVAESPRKSITHDRAKEIGTLL